MKGKDVRQIHADFQREHGPGIYAMFMKAGLDIPKVSSIYTIVVDLDCVYLVPKWIAEERPEMKQYLSRSPGDFIQAVKEELQFSEIDITEGLAPIKAISDSLSTTLTEMIGREPVECPEIVPLTGNIKNDTFGTYRNRPHSHTDK